MLYLFLSGTRLIYLNDILTVLHLPEGILYKLKFPSKIVMDVAQKKNIIGEEVLISYLYDEKKIKESIPLRYGKLKNVTCKYGQVYYDVELGEYCNYCRSSNPTKQFWNDLILNFPDKIRHGKPKKPVQQGGRSGFFAFVGEQGDIKYNIETTEDSWIKTVIELGKCIPKSNKKNNNSTNTDEKVPEIIFTKLQVIGDKSSTQLNGLNWKNEEEYQVDISFYMPKYNEGPMRWIDLCLIDSQGILKIKQSANNMICEQGVVSFFCKPETKLSVQEKLHICIRNKDVEEDSLSDLYYTKAELGIEIEALSKFKRNIGTIICGFIILVCPLLSDIMDGTATVYKVVCSVLTAIATFLLIQLIGEKDLL